jgi:hypothetical protein
VDFATFNWAAIAAVIGAITTVWGIVAILPDLVDAWARVGNRFHVKPITSKSDPDLVGIDELQSRFFTSDVADEMGEIRRYVSQSRKGPADRKDTRPFFMALALKYRGIVVGYLTAEYFPHTQAIFLWYLLVDSTAVPQHTLRQRGSLMLIEAMVKAADATGVPWLHILTEVESAPADVKTAKAKMLLFKNAAETLSRKFGKSIVRVFRLPINYRQPILHLELLPTAKRHEVAEWLLYAPRSIGDGLAEVGGSVTMSRSLATVLLDTLLIKGTRTRSLTLPTMVSTSVKCLKSMSVSSRSTLCSSTIRALSLASESDRWISAKPRFTLRHLKTAAPPGCSTAAARHCSRPGRSSATGQPAGSCGRRH